MPISVQLDDIKEAQRWVKKKKNCTNEKRAKFQKKTAKKESKKNECKKSEKKKPTLQRGGHKNEGFKS